MSRRVALVELAEDAGAVYRLTKLVVDDALTQALREKLIEASSRRLDRSNVVRIYGSDVADAGGPVAYLVGCPWCASVWIAAGVVIARRVFPLPWGLAARGLSMSAITGWLSERS